jgi:hypothetical protein
MAATDYDFILNRNELIEESYRKVGVLADGESITSGQLSTANKKLNLILKSWEGDGVFLWTYQTEVITTVAATAYVAVPTTNGLAYIESAYYTDSGGDDNRLERMSIAQYQDIIDKTDTGEPISFTHRISNGRVYFFPVPNDAYTVTLFGVRRLADWDSASSDGEFPARWQSAIKYSLAVELAEDYKMPLNEVKYLREVAGFEYMKARKKENDTEDCSYVKGAF